MALRFDSMLCSNLSNQNSDTGHINCSRGPYLALEPIVRYRVYRAVADLFLTVMQNTKVAITGGTLIKVVLNLTETENFCRRK